MRLEH
jgi:hypothetical protein